MSGLVHIRRAIVSVSNKEGVEDLAKALARHGVEIISTGGTALAIERAGVPVTPVERLTDSPEVMEGRVKTLHPRVHGGILARRDVEGDMAALEDLGGRPIDLVCVNLYPFEETVARAGATEEEAVEQIDIGGPAMVRAAAKNFRWVTVVTDPRAYSDVLEEMDTHGGATTLALRRRLAARAFAHTARYDGAIAAWLQRADDALPALLSLTATRVGDELRYGENPHQRGAVYRLGGRGAGPSVVDARHLHGKALSYNNIADASAALRLVADLKRLHPERASACVVKHMNPCGAAMGRSVPEAIAGALAGDPLAAFGGILAVSDPLNDEGAQPLCAPDVFFEVLVAPSVEPDALHRLQQRWKNLRILATGPVGSGAVAALEMRSVAGGLLVQTPDDVLPDPASWRLAAGPKPDPAALEAAAALVCVVRALSSNAVAIGGWDGDVIRMFGAGAGQMDRLAACRIAVEKAGTRARGALAVSDAFFPFPDGPGVLIDAGVGMIVQPGGSRRDEETLRLCDQRGVTCMLTGVRHFRH